MHKHVPSILLITALAGGLAFALVPTGSSTSSASQALATGTASPALTATAPPLRAIDETQPLPPGHPAIGGSAANSALDALLPGAGAEAAAVPTARLTWTTPASFREAPNPSTMRLATYRVPRATGDTDDADLSVVQAGGSTDANIERWLGQFDDAGKETRSVRTIAGVKVTVVEVRGTFQGGGMTMGGAASPTASHAHWALLAAIVDVPGTPYFFKMVGPEKSVTAARAAFDALLSSMRVTEEAAAAERAPREGL